MPRRLFVIALLVCAATPIVTHAQTQTRALVTVLDATGAVIPGAVVTVATQSAKADPSGIATIDALAQGRHTVEASFPGFENGVLRDVRIRPGDNRVRITLQVKGVTEALTVGRDGQTKALDPLSNAFSTVLTREMIAALPDDPDEMEAVLKAMAPPGASIRVDGFSGGRLPPKSQIRSIRLPRADMYAAQNHAGLNGAMFIDITTQPGLGPLRGSTDFTFRDTALSARNPFTPVKGDEGLHQYGASFSGTIVPNKSSFSFSAQSARQFDSTSILASTPAGPVAEPVRRPSDRMNVNGSVVSAINADHTMRVVFQRNASTVDNLGVGGFSLPERAFSSTSTENLVRWSESGPLGRRAFTESRFQLRRSENSIRSLLEAPSVVVLDAFTSGGAQQSGVRRATEFEAATDLDYVQGRHSFRAGVLLEAGHYRSTLTANYLGTYTFSSLAAYQARQPASYTRRIGNPDVSYSNVQAGIYGQDDWRIAKPLLLSFGLRSELQTLIPDQNNVSPRVTATYAPFKSGSTTLRAGWGYFTDWFGVSTYEQPLQVDGVRQRQINVRNPSYPDAEGAASTLPADRYLIGDAVALPSTTGAYAGIDQALSPIVRASATYSYRRGLTLLRGRNLNTPIEGVRPDAAFANVVEVVSDAASRTHSLNLGITLTALNWHRTTFFANYSLSRSESNTAGAFSLPADGNDLDAEWGASVPRHRWSAMFSTQPARNVSVTLNLRGQSGMPYNVTTGFDGNGDGVFNDRPAGVGRNSASGAATWDASGRLSYVMGFGRRPSQPTGGGMGVVMRAGGGDAMPGGFSGGAEDKRYRVELYVSAQNITNHDNYSGYSGVLTSPFFGRATSVMNPRKAEVGIRFGF